MAFGGFKSLGKTKVIFIDGLASLRSPQGLSQATEQAQLVTYPYEIFRPYARLNKA